jgi:6-phosphogluconolactonase (cycloisomerase 2 family)
MSTLSAGALLSITSCVQSYSVGFLYVTGTNTAKPGAGIISGFKIDHNTGQLVPVNGLPVSSGGANPGRAVLLQSSRFLYVLNRGLDASNGDNCTSNTQPCKGSNITLFLVGGNGSLSPQPQVFTSQGHNPFRLIADATGTFVMVLDHDAPDSGSGAASNSCTLALGAGVTTCGDITMFKVDPTTGRLSLILNSQVSSATGQPLSYFPVPADPIDFLLNGTYLLTLTGTPSTGDEVFPYSYSGGSGQLSISQNGPQPLNIRQATAIQSANNTIYVLDNEPVTIGSCDQCVFNAGTYPGQILPFAIGTGGALQAQTGGPVPIYAAQSNPLFVVGETKGNWVYVADAGNNQNQNNPQSGISGYVVDKGTRQLRPMPNSPFGSDVGIGAGPQCLWEDPSNQFLYTANFNDSSVTGVVLDQNAGTLSELPGKAAKAYALPGPAAYCVMNGRTS